jgi:proteasome lid subunit RPN8/RPN11
MRLPMQQFNQVNIDRGVILSIIDFARGSHPREFTALLEGKVRKGTLWITGLIYQQYESSEFATVTHLDLPLLHNTVGSVHSHPGPSNRPSRTDLLGFNKHGIIHLIISAPYTEETIVGYDKQGKVLNFSISAE